MSDDVFMHSNFNELTSFFARSVILTQFTDYHFDVNLRITPFLRWVKCALAHTRHEGIAQDKIQACGFEPFPKDALPLPGREHGYDHFKTYAFAPKMLVWLARLKAVVEADGRRLIFLRYPVYPDYAAVFAEEAAKGKDIWANYAPYYKGCIHLDYFNYPLDESMIADADHLSEHGAYAFSQLLETEFIKILHA